MLPVIDHSVQEGLESTDYSGLNGQRDLETEGTKRWLKAFGEGYPFVDRRLEQVLLGDWRVKLQRGSGGSEKLNRKGAVDAQLERGNRGLWTPGWRCCHWPWTGGFTGVI